MKSKSRLLAGIIDFWLDLTLIIVSWLIVWIVIALLIRVLSVDPTTQIAGPLVDNATRELFNKEFNLDAPLISEAGARAVRMMLGDWGVSWRSRDPVVEIVAPATVLSLSIAVLATVFATVVGLVSATLSGLLRNESQRRASVFDAPSSIVVLAAVPSFVTALWITYSPIPDIMGLPRYGLHASGHSLLSSLILPAFCLSLPGIGIAIPRLKATVLTVINANWYKLPVVHGMGSVRVLLTHGLPMLTAVTGDIFAQVLIMSVTGAIAVEYVFSLPGLGTVLFDAVQLGDIPVLLGVVAMATFISFGAMGLRALFSLALPSHMRTGAKRVNI